MMLHTDISLSSFLYFHFKFARNKATCMKLARLLWKATYDLKHIFVSPWIQNCLRNFLEVFINSYLLKYWLWLNWAKSAKDFQIIWYISTRHSVNIKILSYKLIIWLQDISRYFYGTVSERLWINWKAKKISTLSVK